MNPEAAPDKAEWRRQFRAALKNIAPAQRKEDSVRACELLRKQEIWRNARAILFYAALPGELDLTPLIPEALQSGQVVALPRFVPETGIYEAVLITAYDTDCAAGQFGIAEPGAHCEAIPLNRLDLALTPGLGFDLSGRRLGRGQGFYDRLLAEFAGVKCGVAFGPQVVAQLPAEGHDITMNFILTPTRWLEVS